MSVHRFFVAQTDLLLGGMGQPEEAVLRGSEASHAARVLRLQPGEQIVLCDNTGMEYLGHLLQVTVAECRVQITAQRPSPAEPRVTVALFQGLAKGEKMDWVVQKATELGVTAIYPVATVHSVVRLEQGRADTRTQRWKRIAIEAAKQCGRAKPPLVYPVMALAEAMQQSGVPCLLVPWEGALQPLREVLAGLECPPSAIGVVIGPEGGLAATEVEQLQAHGAVPVTLGPRILRTETAAIATLAAVLYAAGEFGGARTMEEWR